MQYAKVFEYMIGMKGNFSITDWVENKEQAGIIYITNYAKLQHTLNPVISLFIQTVGRVLLSQSDDLNNRIFFFLDEFGQLQNLSTIPSLMTASRSKGGSVFIGIQDIGQIDKIYGKDIRTSILNSAANRIIFNCKDHNTAKFFSVDIGETEYYEALESQSLGMSSQDRINTSLQRRKELLIAPEDIQALPDLNAFVSVGHHNVAKSKFKYKKYKTIAQAFIQRPELDLANVVDVMPSIISVTSQIADELEHEQFILGEERSV
jgi:type IV secretory pathway TraG/TraD family ATPase VirD4